MRREPSRHNRDLDQLPPMPPKHFLTSTFRVAFEEYFQPQQQRDAIDRLRRGSEDMLDNLVRTSTLERVEGRVCDRDALLER